MFRQMIDTDHDRWYASALLCLIICLIKLNVYGQSTSVLEKKLLHIDDDSTQIVLLNELAFSLHNAYPAQTLERSRQVIQQLDQSPGWLETQRIIAYKNIGLAFWRLAEYDSSLMYQQMAMRLASDVGNDSLAAKITSNSALVYKEKGQYAASLESSFEAYSAFVAINDWSNQAIVSNNIGVVYKLMKTIRRPLNTSLNLLK